MSLTISQIRRDGGTQSRAALNKETVAEYAEAMSDENTVFPPVVVYFDGRSYWLADGFHRLAAWEQIGREEVPVEIRQGDCRRAILHSVAANSAHGLRRTNADKRRAVMTLLEDEEWGAWSNREIARRCGVSDVFVGKVRGDASANGLQIEESRTVERNGATYQINTQNIGSGSKSVQEDATPKSRGGKSEGVRDLGSSRPQGTHEPQEPDTPDMHRSSLSGLTREGLEDEVLGLRAENAEQRARIRTQTSMIADLKAQIKDLTESDAGRTIGNLQRRVSLAEGRAQESLTKAARLQRQVNAQKAELAKMRGEEIDL